MRDIKFRGKRIDNGEWVTGFVYRHGPPLQCLSGEGKELPSFAILKTGFADWNMPRPIDQWEVDGKTVGQFTGLLDKNGKEIYEGDILSKPLYGDVIVLFNEDVCAFQYAYHAIGNGTSVDGRMTNTLYKHEEYKYEVIGNIYENPELIKSNTHEKNK